MAHRYYMGIDQGTTGTAVLVTDETFRVVGHGYREHRQYYPKPGWVEHDPEEILRALLEAAQDALHQAQVRPEELRCIGLDNQGETCLIWEKAGGRPVYPAIVWQDRRTAQQADQLAQDWGEELHRRTGLIADAYFSATKLRWLLDEIPGLRQRAERGEVLAGTLDSWLLWKLTGGQVHATDPSTASRTMLFSLADGDWDGEILAKLNLPRRILPQIRDSAGSFGVTAPEIFFGAQVPITGALTDQQAALFGHRCFTPGSIKATYGTGCFLLMNVGGEPVYSSHGLLTSVAWGLNGRRTYALDGGVYIAGAAVQWLKNGLKLIESARETEWMAQSVPDTGGMYFVPAFSGLAAPHWDPYARGTIVGLTAGVTREHFVRSTLESIAYQVRDNLDVMRQDSGMAIPAIQADGGMAANAFLMQFQADLLGVPVEASKQVEVTALGAACCAALGRGDAASLEELAALPEEKRRYEPSMSQERRDELLHQWHRAVERAKHWDEHGEM